MIVLVSRGLAQWNGKGTSLLPGMTIPEILPVASAQGAPCPRLCLRRDGKGEASSHRRIVRRERASSPG